MGGGGNLSLKIPKQCTFSKKINLERQYFVYGDRGSSVVKVLCYKSEGRWFDSR